MPESMIVSLAVVAAMIVGGGLLGLQKKQQFDIRWLLIAASLVLVNDLALTSFYGLLPDFVGGSRNWQGKLLALAATVAIASTPYFGWKNSGFTLSLRPGSLRSAIPVSALYLGFFLILALAFPSDSSSVEETAFQLTMPGVEEESFYRGTLLFALNEAFRHRVRLLGVDWGWGAVVSSVLFGLAHALGYSDGAFSFDIFTMALTAIPAFIGVWLREKTGSILLPLLLHNFGNSISIFV